jgi:hypothetical protein
MANLYWNCFDPRMFTTQPSVGMHPLQVITLDDPSSWLHILSFSSILHRGGVHSYLICRGKMVL